MKKTYTTVACSGCGTCCTVPIVPVTDSDVARLTAATGKCAAELVRFYKPEELEFDRDAEVWIRFSYGKRAMGLRRKRGRCQFLTNDARCSVYAHRPMTCRTFPYAIEFDDDGKVFCVDLNKIVTCKATPMPPSPLTQVRKDVLQEELEDEHYFAAIRSWGYEEKKGGTKEFLAFLGFPQKKQPRKRAVQK